MITRLRVRDYMVSEPVTVRAETEVMSVARLLVEKNISGAIVVDEDRRVLGIITERDLIEVAVSAGYFDERGGSVSEYMTRNVESVGPEEGLIDIAARFARSRYRRYPVLESGRLIGVIARRDVLRALRSDSWFVDSAQPGPANGARGAD